MKFSYSGYTKLRYNTMRSRFRAALARWRHLHLRLRWKYLSNRKKSALIAWGIFISAFIYVFLHQVPETKLVHMVCLTNKPPDKPASGSYSVGSWYIRGRKTELPTRECDRVQKNIKIYTESPPWITNRQLAGFTVEYHHISELPKTHKVIEHETAYFLGNNYDFEPENFYHFTKQVYFPLHWLVKSTNHSKKGAHNVVFYPKIYGICHSGKYHYHDINRYYFFLEILNVTNKLELSVFNDKPEPHNVCYKNAVFSSDIFLDKAAEATDFFKQKLGVTDHLCSSNLLVIINRSGNRRILNIDKLREVGLSLGYDTQVVYMEKLTYKEQAQLIHCTKILVGVTGAGLQWAFLMKNHSGVVEIAWPYHHWPFFFTGNINYNSEQKDVIRPLNFVRLSDVTCHLNPKAFNKYYEEIFYMNSTFTEEEQESILQDPRNYHFWRNTITSLGKIYDIKVNPLAFREAVISAASGG